MGKQPILVPYYSYTEQEENIRRECLEHIDALMQEFYRAAKPYQDILARIDMAKTPTYTLVEDNG